MNVIDTRCLRCGCDMEPCDLKLSNLGFGSPVDDSSLVVRKPGAKVSMNPITAFRQGLNGEPDDIDYPLVAYRCRSCSKVELYAPPS